MEEKQEFQLGDTFYLVFMSGASNQWRLRKESVTGVVKGHDGIYLKSPTVSVLQRECGHTLAEAKDIAIKNYYQEIKGQIKEIRNLTE